MHEPNDTRGTWDEAGSMAPPPSQVESAWFAPRRYPIGSELDHRRGWQRPPPSRGLGFAVVSFALIGTAIAGTFFFLAPESRTKHKRDPEPIATTHVTSAEPASALPPEPPQAEETAAKPSEPAPATKPPAPAATGMTAKTRAPSSPPKKQPEPRKATGRTGESTLPDLDRAAKAVGLTPVEEDPFATPNGGLAPVTPPSAAQQQEAPPFPTGSERSPAELSPGEATPPPRIAPSPDALPEVELKQ